MLVLVQATPCLCKIPATVPSLKTCNCDVPNGVCESWFPGDRCPWRHSPTTHTRTTVRRLAWADVTEGHRLLSRVCGHCICTREVIIITLELIIIIRTPALNKS